MLAPPDAKKVGVPEKSKHSPKRKEAGTTLPSNASSAGLAPRLPTAVASGGIIQAKLKIGAPNDSLEREADALADHISQAATPASPYSTLPTPTIPRVCPSCSQTDDRKMIQHSCAACSRTTDQE